MPEINNVPYIVAAYVVTWFALIGYGVHLVRSTLRAASRYAEQHAKGGRAS